MAAGSRFVKSIDFHLDYKQIYIDHKEPLVHYHDKIEIALFLTADVRIYVKDRFYEITGGDMMLLEPYQVHRIEYKPGTPYTRYVLNIAPNLIQDVLKAIGHEEVLNKYATDRNAVIRCADTIHLESLRAIFALMWHALQTMPDTDERIALFKLHTASLILLFMTLPEKGNHRRATVKEDKINQVLLYLNEHYLEEISLSALADHFFINKFYLGHAFKEISGMTITDYVQFKRISEAKRLLKQTNRTVLEISLDCGFHNVQHFHRVFKKLTNLTPYQYKRLT